MSGPLKNETEKSETEHVSSILFLIGAITAVHHAPNRLLLKDLVFHFFTSTAVGLISFYTALMLVLSRYLIEREFANVEKTITPKCRFTIFREALALENMT